MKRELKKLEFNVAQFEILETSGEMLKGGFSTAYTGAAAVAVDVDFNFVKQCGCTTNTCNTVKGCSCSVESVQ